MSNICINYLKRKMSIKIFLIFHLKQLIGRITRSNLIKKNSKMLILYHLRKSTHLH